MSLSTVEYYDTVCHVLIGYGDVSELDIKLVTTPVCFHFSARCPKNGPCTHRPDEGCLKNGHDSKGYHHNREENVVMYQVLHSNDFDDADYKRMWSDMMCSFDNTRIRDGRRTFLSCLLLTYWPEVFDRFRSIGSFEYMPSSERLETRKKQLDYSATNRLWPELGRIKQLTIPVFELPSTKGGRLRANTICWLSGTSRWSMVPSAHRLVRKSIRCRSYILEIAATINTDTETFNAIFGPCDGKIGQYVVAVTMESGNKYLVTAYGAIFGVMVKKTDDFTTGLSLCPESTLSAVYSVRHHTDAYGNSRCTKVKAILLGGTCSYI